jgi:hypothetical protein
MVDLLLKLVSGKNTINVLPFNKSFCSPNPGSHLILVEEYDERLVHVHNPRKHMGRGSRPHGQVRDELVNVASKQSAMIADDGFDIKR